MELDEQPVLNAELLEWQTGSVEVAVSGRACGFKSHIPHYKDLNCKLFCRSYLRLVIIIGTKREAADNKAATLL